MKRSQHWHFMDSTVSSRDPLHPNGVLREAFDSKTNANGIRVVCGFFEGVGASCKEYSRDLKDPHLWNVRETFSRRFFRRQMSSSDANLNF